MRFALAAAFHLLVVHGIPRVALPPLLCMIQLVPFVG